MEDRNRFFRYLDKISTSGINTFGAIHCLKNNFGLTEEQSRLIFEFWRDEDDSLYNYWENLTDD